MPNPFALTNLLGPGIIALLSITVEKPDAGRIVVFSKCSE
jgi:hypothetical protein